LSFGDGYKGLPSFAPFDKIIITCGAPDVPEELLNQLKVGGVMVIPIGEGEEQLMKRITKVSEHEVEIEDFGVFKFVPMLENKVK
jgi:protein-L-isoaspartate(D-aspartate) O-methyltransferase